MAIADLVLIPVLPSALDIMAGRDALRLAQEARQEKGGLLKIGLVPSRMARTRLGADLMVALAAMGETLLPAISSRAIVAESVLSGQSVREAGPKTPSAQEFEAFAAGVERMLTA
jgi:chromosome partitioning protein